MPFFIIEKACFSNLLHTAIKANFLLFPLATIRSKSALQDLLYLQALKLHIKNSNYWDIISNEILSFPKLFSPK